MPGTYKTIELVGTSPVSFAEAVKAAVADASATVRHMDWFEVVQERGRIDSGQVQEFQVTLKVGFKIELGDRPPATQLGTALVQTQADREFGWAPLG
jgi:dodecin